LIFKGNFFVYRPIRVKLSGIFALARSGLKVKKNRGWGSPFGRNLMVKLKLWPQISRPLIIRGRRLGVGSTRGLGPYLRKPNPQPGPSNLGGKNYFMKNFFSAENCRAKTGHYRQTKRGVALTPFQLRSVGEVSPLYGSGRQRDPAVIGGATAPQNWVKFWILFKCPQKIEGVVGESFPLEGILSPEVRHG